MLFGRLTVLMVLVTVLCMNAVQAFADSPVEVYAASSLKPALDDVGTAYQRKFHATLRFTYGSTASLVHELESGGRADLFFSADSEWMTYAVQRRKLDGVSRRDLLINHLALIAPSSSRLRLAIGRDMPLGAALGDGRLAIATSGLPAGRSGRAALQALNIWDSVKNRLAEAANPQDVMLRVERGQAPLGIVYESDARTSARLRIVGYLPETGKSRMVYAVALASRSKNAQAPLFLSYLKSREAAAIFTRHGFGVIPR